MPIGGTIFPPLLDTITPLHHYPNMRLSVNLDDENYRLAKSLAREEDISISKAINRLLKRQLPLSPESGPQKTTRSGFPRVSGKQTVTTSDVADFLSENP